jgi:hypothetical protein
MATYMISYDLHPSKDQSYDELFAALETIGTGYWDCLESTCALRGRRGMARISTRMSNLA